MATIATKQTPSAPKRKSRFFATAERLGLVGCISGPPDLAKNYKRYLSLKLRAGKKTAA